VKKPRTDDWTWVNDKSNKDLWTLSRIPEGEANAPYIKRSSKNSDGSHTFWIYRNGKYIDSSFDLEEAKKIAKTGAMRPERLLAVDKIRRYLKDTPRDAAAFAKLHEREKQAVTDVYPWAVPRKSDLEKKGVSAPRVTRGDLLTKQEKKAQDLPMDSVIKRLKPKNPKKENTDAWTRWELLFQHDGKTIGEFVKNHGNPTTLRNAVRSGHVSAEGVK
jgi:hypothetical protein